MNKTWKRNKFLTPAIAVIVILVLTIPCSTIIAGNLQTPTENKILSVMMHDVNGEDYSIKKNISEEKFNELNVSTSSLLTLAKNTLDDNSPGGKNITILEWDNIEKAIIKIIDIIKAVIGPGFPFDAIIAFLISLINLFHGPIYIVRQPLLSFGIGVTWVPFYDYETFIGRMLRPIFMRHLVGFSATARLRPFRLGFPYFYFGLQRVRTFFFRGLLINFADLGINRILGPQILIGYGVFTGFIH